MARKLSEKNVLKKLGIDSFSQLDKSKTIELASMLDRLDPEVAQKVFEQFPEFTQTMREMLQEYKETLDKGMESNDTSVKNVYDTYKTIISSLQNELDKDEHSFEEKKYIIEQMKDLADKIDKKDSENKKWLAGMVTIGACVAVGAATGLAVILGGKIDIKQIGKR